jgi:hypothetical protein
MIVAIPIGVLVLLALFVFGRGCYRFGLSDGDESALGLLLLRVVLSLGILAAAGPMIPILVQQNAPVVENWISWGVTASDRQLVIEDLREQKMALELLEVEADRRSRVLTVVRARHDADTKILQERQRLERKLEAARREDLELRAQSIERLERVAGTEAEEKALVAVREDLVRVWRSWEKVWEDERAARQAEWLDKATAWGKGVIESWPRPAERLTRP